MAFNLLRYQLANRPQKWSFKSKWEYVRQKTQTLIQRLFGKKENAGLIQRNANFRSGNVEAQLKFPERSYLNFFRQASQWSRDTLTSAVSGRSGHRLFRGATGATVSFAGFALSTKSSILTEQDELEGLSFEIREAFAKVPPDVGCPTERFNPSLGLLKDLEIGSLLAKGCNAVVYSAAWKQNHDEKDSLDNEDQHLTIPPSEAEMTCNYDAFIPLNTKLSTGSLMPFNLAVKLMFNYSAKSDATTIWKAMFKEALPAIQNVPFRNARESKNRGIPPHPNIVEMHCAFVDEMPLLPDALSNYPQALPFRLAADGFGRNMTLFLIMKRYHCSLSEYLKEYQPSPRTSLLLFCQLLEGLVHLLQNGFVHRDLKTDNILLDLTQGLSNPVLAITDFGCCLEGLKLPYVTEELDRGGNMALMAPEVVTAEAGAFSVIDYCRADLWTIGTMAYEIFGVKNPFYMSNGESLESLTYLEEDLPQLPPGVPPVVEKLVHDILQRDPRKRPAPSLAATVCQLLLHAPPELLVDSLSKGGCKKIIHWFVLMSAETYLKTSMSTSKVRQLEFQLQYNFCRRIQFSELLQALRYMSQV